MPTGWNFTVTDELREADGVDTQSCRASSNWLLELFLHFNGHETLSFVEKRKIERCQNLYVTSDGSILTERSLISSFLCFDLFKIPVCPVKSPSLPSLQM